MMPGIGTVIIELYVSVARSCRAPPAGRDGINHVEIAHM
jgi:hypothetical protein